MKNNHSTDSLLNGLLRHDKRVVKFIYKQYFPMIKNMVLKSPNTSTADAEDIFVIGLEAIYVRLEQGELTLDCQFSSFLYEICKRQWSKELRKRNRVIDQKTLEKRLYPHHSESNIQKCLEEAEKLSLYREQFEKLGNSCKQLLELGFKGFSAGKIAQKMGFRNASYVHKKRCLCRKKLMQLIHKDARFSEIKY